MQLANQENRRVAHGAVTPLQGQYLAFVHTYEGIHGCAPAEADLQRHFGVTPPSVHQMVVTLERKGLISLVAGVRDPSN